MILIGITLLLGAILAMNYAVNGVPCWHFYRGGQLSAQLYDLQMVVALFGVVWLLVSLWRRSVPRNALQLTVVAGFIVASIVTYNLFGWTAYCSSHDFGEGNLLAYLTVAATAYLIGRYSMQERQDAV